MAGILCIFASIVWAGAACATLVLKKRPGAADFSSPDAHATAVPADGSTPTAEQAVRKTLGPDGSLTTVHTTTITNPDGSKTVTETTDVTPPSEWR
jgi:hypothetical protein